MITWDVDLIAAIVKRVRDMQLTRANVIKYSLFLQFLFRNGDFSESNSKKINIEF